MSRGLRDLEPHPDVHFQFCSFILMFFNISALLLACEEKLSSPRALSTCGEELSEVVRRCDQEPLGPCFGVSAKAELPEALHVLDLTDRRFDDALAFCIETPPLYGEKLADHAFLDREIPWDRSSRTLRQSG